MQITESDFFNELHKKLQELQLQDQQNPEESQSEEPSQRDIQPKLNSQFNTNYEIDIPLSSNGRILNKFENLRIQDFDIGPTLGTGTFGRVRQAKLKNDKNQEVFALKMLKKTEIVRLNQVEHTISEKSILSKITFPFIVMLKGTFQDEKYVYMIFEYISGGELFSRLRKEGRFSNDVALFYTTEILLTIQHLHKQNIVYRDLKPENLLIDKEGHIKITDFGFAKVLNDDRTYTLCGTPEYLAPEIIQGSRTGYGKSVDWWALGILIFEMLSGYPPFYDNEPVGIYKKIIAGIIEFPRFFDIRAKDVIRKLLNPELEYRLGVKDQGRSVMKHKWFKGVKFEDVQSKLITPPWIPVLKSDEDSSWFEKYKDSVDPPKQLPDKFQYLFECF